MEHTGSYWSVVFEDVKLLGDTALTNVIIMSNILKCQKNFKSFEYFTKKQNNYLFQKLIVALSSVIGIGFVDVLSVCLFICHRL